MNQVIEYKIMFLWGYRQ